MNIFVKKDIEWSRYSALSFGSSGFSGGRSQSFGKSVSSGLARNLRRVRMSGVLREYRDFFSCSIESESGSMVKVYHKWLSVSPALMADMRDGTSGFAKAT